MFCFFFFQAEDGIRDLVRSRGLGDVYKRQFFIREMRVKNDAIPGRHTYVTFKPLKTGTYQIFCTEYCGLEPVSYTHLTLPTSDLV